MTLLIWYCHFISFRPIAGYVNFCSSQLIGKNDDFIFDVAKHEVLRALVSNIQIPPSNLVYNYNYNIHDLHCFRLSQDHCSHGGEMRMVTLYY